MLNPSLYPTHAKSFSPKEKIKRKISNFYIWFILMLHDVKKKKNNIFLKNAFYNCNSSEYVYVYNMIYKMLNIICKKRRFS